MGEMFSIIIPVHNRERHIKDTLLSVVGQDYRPLHLILVDNNSTDDSIKIAKEYLQPYETPEMTVTYASEQKAGACAARNRGVTLATAPYMMFIDDDDTLSTFKAVTTIVDAFKKSGADIVGFKARHCFSNGKKRIRHFSFTNDIKEQVIHCMLSTQCYAIKREFYDRVGGWDEQIKRWQDWNLGIRALLLNPKIEWIKQPYMVNIRVHNQSITGNGYLHSAEALEEAILLTAAEVDKTSVENREEVIASIYGRLPILAAHYRREGGADAATRAIALYYQKTSLTAIQKIVIKLLCLYTMCGGKGAGRVINRMRVKLNRQR